MSLSPIAVVGPSGAGKDLLMSGAVAERPELYLLRRVITRPSSAGGEDFEGVSDEEFAKRAEAGEFALHWQAHGLRYGIPKAEFARPGRALMNLSRAVLPQAQALWPDLKVLHVTAPPEVLAARLAGRGRETAASQGARLARASLEMPAGIVVQEVMNDASPELGLRRFLAALSL